MFIKRPDLCAIYKNVLKKEEFKEQLHFRVFMIKMDILFLGEKILKFCCEFLNSIILSISILEKSLSMFPPAAIAL